MTGPGANNSITDVKGITVGNATDEKAATGVTVLRCEQSFHASVDIRGGAPGVRETDTLAPENLVGKADAIVLTGGSIFGLGAADGAANALSVAGVGLRLADKGPHIPIVPAAVLHDLGNDGDKDWGETPPYARLGAEAVKSASESFKLGSVGAGRGAAAGTLKGGLGSASLDLGGGIVVGALVAANPAGSVVMDDGETFYAWPWELDGEFGGQSAPVSHDGVDPFPAHSRLGAAARAGANTTIAIVATSADLTTAECKRMAITAHDGIARAIRPAHTLFDGDVVFSVATAAQQIPTAPEIMRSGLVARISAAAADCLARAIARAVYEARQPK